MRFFALVVCVVVAGASIGCGWLDDRPTPTPPANYSAAAQSQSSAIYTSARPTMSAAVNDYFWVKPTPTQPLEFPHKTHIEKGLTCTEYCHESVTKGPEAGLPSLNTCMTCHSAIATEAERIKQITAQYEKGLDMNWQRVYKFAEPAHVKFNHAPHIRANVECATCHGDIAQQTVAQRNVTLDMGFCVSCHREKNAPNDCLTCHF